MVNLLVAITVGFFYAEIKARKKRDLEENADGLWKPVFEASQGLLDPAAAGGDGGTGRPQKPGTKKTKDGPRPSHGE